MNTNPELELALQLVEQTGTSLFLTGKAGTGKTTFLRTLVEKLPKRMVVLAPTGIAAINAGGMTIHSFFQLPLAPFVPGTAYGGDAKYKYRFSKEKLNIIRSLDLLVIDEVSMVRADLLDSIDDVLRRYKDRYKPFGGTQLLLIGDIQQLPPVVKDDEWQLLSQYYDSPYFFSSLALKQTTYCTIELKKVYRQSDQVFLSMLNAIRENRCDAAILRQLNERYIPHFDPDRNEGYIRLTTHNYQAQRINEQKLAQLSSKSVLFTAEINGDFPEFSYPTDLHLELRTGAQVMFIKNDVSGQHRYANGTIGVVTMLTSAGVQVTVDETGECIDVQKEVWTNAKYKLNEKTKEIEEEIEGEFTQYPLKLAWAITVHKSQGLTFDKAIIDVSSAFAHGQTYVALSRCRTLQGIVLSSPIPEKALISDGLVDQFIRRSTASIPNENQCQEMQRLYFLDLLNELFDFYKLEHQIAAYKRLLDEHFYRTFPALVAKYAEELERYRNELTLVGSKFRSQYYNIVSASADYHADSTLQTRIHSAATYFFDHLQPLVTLLAISHVSSDNKQTEQRRSIVEDALRFDTRLKLNLLAHVRDKGFAVGDYLRTKAILNIEKESPKPAAKQRSRVSVNKNALFTGTEDIRNIVLYDSLREWRKAKSVELDRPAYTILQQKALLGIANYEPKTRAALLTIAYVGETTVKRYGDEILEIVRKATS